MPPSEPAFEPAGRGRDITRTEKLAMIDRKLAQIEQEPQGTPFERARVIQVRRMWQRLRDRLDPSGPATKSAGHAGSPIWNAETERALRQSARCAR